MEEINDTFLKILENDAVRRIITLLIVSIVILGVIYYIKRSLSRYVQDTDMKYRARKISNFLGYFLLVTAVLFVYNDKLGNIGMALGLAGAGIAFALQEVIISIAGWLNIMFSNQLKIGQRVKIGDIKGDIIDIGVLKTTIMEMGDWVDGDLYNGRITTLSNNFVFKNALQNYSADYPFLWDEITVPIRTESNFKLAKKIFTEIIEEVTGDFSTESQVTWNKMKNKFRVEDARVQPLVTLSFDENWITYTIRYVVHFRKRRITKDIIFTRLLEEINRHEDEMKIAVAASEVTTLPPPEDYME